jgi:hypothetical protein
LCRLDRLQRVLTERFRVGHRYWQKILRLWRSWLGSLNNQCFLSLPV